MSATRAVRRYISLIRIHESGTCFSHGCRWHYVERSLIFAHFFLSRINARFSLVHLRPDAIWRQRPPEDWKQNLNNTPRDVSHFAPLSVSNMPYFLINQALFAKRYQKWPIGSIRHRYSLLKSRVLWINDARGVVKRLDCGWATTKHQHSSQ